MLRNGYRYIIVAEENSPESMEARFDSDVDGIWYVDGLDGTSTIVTLRTQTLNLLVEILDY